jgi:2-methylcitrate dehydratase PrpD
VRGDRPTSLTRTIGEFARSTQLDDLPQVVVLESRRLLVDTVGCALGGLQTNSGRIALRYAQEVGGRPTATVLGLRERSQPAVAAYVNARLANTLDADDTFQISPLFGYHFGNAVVFSALAVAEHLESSVDDLLCAIAVGFEVGARIARWLGLPYVTSASGPVWNDAGGPAAILTLAAAGAAANLARLSATRTGHLLSLAGANTPQPTIRKWAEAPTQSMYKYADAGQCASVAVTAWQLAALGSTSFDDILDGENGLWRFYGAAGVDNAALLAGLGTDWSLPRTTYKPWPSCRWTHEPLTALMRLMEEHRLTAGSIQKALVRANPLATTPIFQEQRPRDPLSAQFSHPHSVAAAALGIPPGPMWYCDEVLQSDEVSQLRERVTVIAFDAGDLDAAGGGQPQLVASAGVDLTTADGIVSAVAEHALGDPIASETRFEDKDLLEKFVRMTASGADEREARALAQLMLEVRPGGAGGLPFIESLQSIGLSIGQLRRD